MVAVVLMPSVSLPWPFAVFGILACLFAVYVVITEGGRSRLLCPFLIAVALASVGCVHAAHASFVYVPYCEGIFYYLTPACW